MFAVIRTGGKQYRVSAGDEFTVEKLAAAPGETIRFDDVLMLGGESVSVGTPLIAGASVRAEVLEQGRGEKVYNFKKRRRKHGSKRLKGHRQALTTVRILEILKAGAKASSAKTGNPKTGNAKAETGAKTDAKAAKATKATKAKATPAAKPETKAKAAPKTAKPKAAKPKAAPKTAKAGTQDPKS